MSTIILSFLVLLISFSLVHGDPNVPCYFIFGDSLSDAGNNNDLDTKAKVNYSPYGVDFPGGVATGRFTNGLTTPDVLTGLLGLEGLIPPFRTASGNKILKGVNYASGGAGVLSESGSHLGDRIWLARQVQNHQKTIADLGAYVKGPVSDYLNKCLYTVNIGSNDYINNYFMPKLYPSKNVSTPDQFATSVISEYEAQIKALYKLGARKTALFGLGMIGCVPAEKRINKATLCVDEINDAVELINDKLLSLVDSLNAQLAGAKFTFIDISGVQGVTPLALGLLTTPCCKLRSDYQCEASKSSCLVRDIYSFMDGFHPTEVVNRLTAKISYSSPLHLFVHPVNIRDLVSNLNHTVQTSYRPDPIQRISYVQDLASSADVSSF